MSHKVLERFAVNLGQNVKGSWRIHANVLAGGLAVHLHHQVRLWFRDLDAFYPWKLS